MHNFNQFKPRKLFENSITNNYHLWWCEIHTYIIGHYNLSVRILELVSHTIYVVCVNFIHKRQDLQFQVGSERQIFEKCSIRWVVAPICWNQISFTPMPWRAGTKKSVFMVRQVSRVTVTIAQFLFSKKLWPMMSPLHKPQQIVTRNAKTGFCKTWCQCSVPQILQFFLLKYPPKWK